MTKTKAVRRHRFNAGALLRGAVVRRYRSSSNAGNAR